MLKLLLDEQISPSVADGLRRRDKDFVVHCAEWRQGQFLGAADELLLGAAAEEKLTLVTYDRKSIPPILKTWAEQERTDGGVVFVDDKTIASSDFGTLVRSLERL